MSAASSGSAPVSVVLAGGGTAGHVSPLLAIAAAIRRRDPDANLLAVGTATGMETRLVPAAGIELATIERVPLPRSLSTDLLRVPGKLRGAVRQAGRILDDAAADVVLGVGGYVSTPVYLAARKRKIPVVIHEANVTPGLANRVGARFANVVATAFPETKLPGARHVGMPMESAIGSLEREERRAAARERFNVPTDRPLLAVTGGSSGALSINRAITSALGDLGAAGIHVLHVTGRGKQIESQPGELLSAPNYTQVEYVDGMADFYAAADVVVCRSGAGTVNELAAVGVPSVLVPLPHGNGEQARNAALLVDHDAAILVRDSDLTPAWIAANIPPLLTDPQRLGAMADAARVVGIRDADDVMAELVLDAAGGGRG